MGHSQGAHVVAYTAMNNQYIQAMGYFGGNVMGRFSQMINEVQNLSKSRFISPSISLALFSEIFLIK